MEPNYPTSDRRAGQSDSRSPGRSGRVSNSPGRRGSQISGHEDRGSALEQYGEDQTFLTQESRKDDGKPREAPFTVNDLLFPGGKVAKLCKIPNPRSRDFRPADLLRRLNISEQLPVILLTGVEGDIRSRILVGIARAAYSTDAVIVSTGMKCGIETACYRKKVQLMGVCPEAAIQYPTNNSTGDRLGELSGGHSHFFVIGRQNDYMRWDGVVNFKMELIERLRKGRGAPGSYVCRAMCVFVGDNTNHLWELEKALNNDWPVLVIEESPVGQDISQFLRGKNTSLPKSLQQALKQGRVFLFPPEGTAEHLASAVHMHLIVSI